MKKLFTIISVLGLMIGSGVTASGDNPKLCVFTETTTFARWDGLTTEILIDNGEMVIAPGSNDQLRLPLSSVTAIAYGESNDGVQSISESIFSDIDETVEVSDIDGTYRGRFISAAEAARNLPQGVYIFKSDSFTLKVRIK